MEEKDEKKAKRKSTATVKKAFIWGQVTQKMMSFRIDIELAVRLNQEPNKGRLINELLRKHYDEVDAANPCRDLEI